MTEKGELTSEEDEANRANLQDAEDELETQRTKTMADGYQDELEELEIEEKKENHIKTMADRYQDEVDSNEITEFRSQLLAQENAELFVKNIGTKSQNPYKRILSDIPLEEQCLIINEMEKQFVNVKKQTPERFKLQIQIFENLIKNYYNDDPENFG